MPDEKHPTPAERDEPIKIDLDPEATLRGLLKVDPESEPVDVEAWARERVKVSSVPHGRSAVTVIAVLEADGQIFERRADGEVRKGKALAAQLTDALVGEYVEFARLRRG